MFIDKVEHQGIIYLAVDSESTSLPADTIATAIAKQEWAKVRARRDALLRASDYAVMPDYPLTAEQKKTVTAYRQALRDIPETADDPDAIEWPEKPEVLT